MCVSVADHDPETRSSGGYAMWHCILQLDLTFRSGFSAGVYSFVAEMTRITALQLNVKAQKWEILLTSFA